MDSSQPTDDDPTPTPEQKYLHWLQIYWEKYILVSDSFYVKNSVDSSVKNMYNHGFT